MIPSGPNSYNFGAWLDYGKTTGSKHQAGSIVSTKDLCLATANLQRSSCLSMASTALPENPPPPLPHAKASEARSIVCTNAAETVRTINLDPQTAQSSGQSQSSLSGQKNTIPNGLDSRNYCRAVSRNQKNPVQAPSWWLLFVLFIYRDLPTQ
jgi:hypothetical protein